FSADQARYIKERKWSKTQKIKKQDDGSVILSMKTSGWWDVKKRVLSYGSDAEVLEPEELRKEIINDLKTACERYT
ncbi:MAG: WYL domain-containing protein, partial [Thermodesulfobacteriota bacterium]|nr:WYL domain-containing protein [Thermodesulfobacteriota bacterium]